MRLAHFIQRYPPALGGSEAYFARLSEYCVTCGDTVTVFTTNALALEAFWSPGAACLAPGVESDAGVSVRRFPLWRLPGRRWLLKPLSLVPHRPWQCLTLPCNPISVPMWRDASRAEAPFDAVHAAAFPYAFPILCARRLARRLRVPFFISPFLHLGDPNDERDPTRRAFCSPALRWLLNEADAIFVQTPSERNAALALGLPNRKIILQGLGVDVEECTGGNRHEARRRWALPANAFVVGHLANNSWEKGTNDLLAALESLWRDGREIHVLLAGPQMPNFAAFWQSFQQRCRAFAMHRVRRLGPITDAQKRDFFAAIDAFALPSRSDSFGLVLLEAWANGVANIGYRAGGIADVIRHGVDGMLVSCGNIEALADGIRNLHDNDGLRIALGRRGKERLPTDFVWQDKLALVRDAISDRCPRAKKTRTAEASRTLPTLSATQRFE